MSTADPTDEKSTLFRDAYEQLSGVFVEFDTRHDLCVVPDYLKNQPVATFQYGRGLLAPTTDIQIDQEGITCSLRFGGVWQSTYVPWGAIFCVRFDMKGEQRGRLWPEFVPKGARELASRETPDVAAPMTDAQRVQQPNGTYSLLQFRANRAAKAR